MISNRSTRALSNCNLAFLLALIILISSAVTLFAEDTVLILDPKYYWTAVQKPIQGTADTVIGFYHRDSDRRKGLGQITAYTQQEAKHLDLMQQSGLTEARSILAQTNPFVLLDKHGVITALRFQSNDPGLSSIILLPEIASRYVKVLGPGGCYAAIPDRQNVYLFPRLSLPFRAFNAEISTLFHNSSWPISLDLFEITPEKGIRCVGKFRDDDL
jgi:hypothetical protein